VLVPAMLHMKGGLWWDVSQLASLRVLDEIASREQPRWS